VSTPLVHLSYKERQSLYDKLEVNRWEFLRKQQYDTATIVGQVATECKKKEKEDVKNRR
jgi:hypothetical protein